MAIAGGLLLRADASLSSTETTIWAGFGRGGNFWSLFVLGGILMLGVALIMARRLGWARQAAICVVAVFVILFGLAAQSIPPDSDHLLAYGFIAGGVVVGIAVVFAGSFGEQD
jgi:hypothetical protein